ncbi:MAG TPA: hypothetical protein VJ888_10165, partial [Mobilitalea sp.]|nr:hypothetical protein [Mobilitalea sp.]
MFKRKIFTVLTLVISCFLSNTVAASTSVTTVNGCISPTFINVSAPAKVIFSIDPNAEKSNQFISPMIVIENHSNAPVKVKIENGAQNFTQTDNSKWKPIDVLPNGYRWDMLGTRESESYLALGMKAVQGSWRKLNREEPLYVKEQNKSIGSIVFGELNGNSSAQLVLISNYG